MKDEVGRAVNILCPSVCPCDCARSVSVMGIPENTLSLGPRGLASEGHQEAVPLAGPEVLGVRFGSSR